MNPKVDAYLERETKWRAESEKLRALAREFDELTEELKWGKPCYMLGESNLLIIQGFKDYCALMFCKGALLKDSEDLLSRPGENTQAARQLRFKNLAELEKMAPTVKAYIQEAIAAEKAGLKVAFKVNPEPVPEELQGKLDADPAFRAAFQALTPGRRRAYILNISAAKQSKTRAARVEKYAPRILSGKGLDD